MSKEIAKSLNYAPELQTEPEDRKKGANMGSLNV